MTEIEDLIILLLKNEDTKAKSAIKLNKSNFSIFFSREMSEFDEAYLISQFKISNKLKFLFIMC